MRRRVLVLCVILAVLCASLAWTGGKQEVPSKPVTINMWVLAGQINDIWQIWKPMYEKAHPQVKINITPMESQNLKDTANSSLASRKENIDLMWYWGGGRVDEWARAGLLVDLTKYFQSYKWYDRLYSAAKNYEVKGVGNFFVSEDWVSTPTFYYNKAIFKEAGITPPKGFDEIFDNTKKIKAAGYQTWVTAQKDVWPSVNLFNQLTARMMTKADFDKLCYWPVDPKKSAKTAEIYLSQSVKDSFNFMIKMVKEGVFVDGVTSIDYVGSEQLFTKGKAAIHQSGSWAMNPLKKAAPELDFDYFNFPSYKGSGAEFCVSFANGLIVPVTVGKEKLPVVIDIINSMITEEYALRTFDAGLVTASLEVSSDKIEKASSPMFARFASDVKKSGGVDLLDSWTNTLLNKVLYEVCGAVVGGKMTADEASKALYDAAVESLK